RAARGPGQFAGAGHDGHRDAALDRGDHRPDRGPHRHRRLPRRADPPHPARPPRRDRRDRGRRRLAGARCPAVPDRRTPQPERRPRQGLMSMAIPNHPPATADIAALKARAKRMRHHMLAMARGPGQGYIGQGLGIADALAALYFHELRWSPDELTDPDRDRFLLSTGHYSIALWAALAEAGVLPLDELVTYGADDSRLQMSTLDTTPGVEIIGGSLGHGLGQGVGMAL